MSAGKLLRMKPRRRREARTDYRARLKLVKSGLERLVIRKTNRRLIVQLIKSKQGGDICLLNIASDMLSKYGWKASFKSTPAAYLTGLLLGKKALEKGFKKAILDIGIHRSVKGSRLYAVAKGAIDAGLDIPIADGMLPEEDRILGRHITTYYQMVKQNPASLQFTKLDGEYLQNLEKNILTVKEIILGGGGDE